MKYLIILLLVIVFIWVAMLRYFAIKRQWRKERNMPKHLIYVRNNKCCACGKDVIYYSHVKKLVCNCGDIEAEQSPEALKTLFVTFEDFVRKELSNGKVR